MITEGQPFGRATFDASPASLQTTFTPHGFPVFEHTTNCVETIDVDLLQPASKSPPTVSTCSSRSEEDATLPNGHHILVIQCNIICLAWYLFPRRLDGSAINVLCFVHSTNVTAIVDRKVHHV
jgi:hypothetical protein